MKIVEQMQRIKIIHELIEKKRTGTPEEFSKTVDVSKRQLYNILEELKLMGAPIMYDIKQKSYIYTKSCKLDLKFELEFLDEKKCITIFGGSSIMSCNSILFSNKIHIN